MVSAPHRLIAELGIPTLVVWSRRIDHVLVVGHWRMIQNCRVYQSAQFLNTDHRLVVSTLKLQLKSVRMVPSQIVASSRMRGQLRSWQTG